MKIVLLTAQQKQGQGVNMALFTKVSTGATMTDCEFYDYINSPKGFCCEKGWLWEYIGMQKTGRQWKKWLQETSFACDNFYIELTNYGTPVFANSTEFDNYFLSIGYTPISYEQSEGFEKLYINGNTFMHDAFLKDNPNINTFNSDTVSDANLFGISSDFFQGCLNLGVINVASTFRHFGLTQSEDGVFDGCINLTEISCSLYFAESNNGGFEGDLRYAQNSFSTFVNLI